MFDQMETTMRMDIYHISAECFPVAKVGGLADVVGALPKYQHLAGNSAKVVVPGYDNTFTRENAFETVHQGYLNLGAMTFHYSVLKESSGKLGYDLYLIAIPQLFDRPDVYSYPDDTERFTAFQIAFLNWLSETSKYPDIIHCHDHHTGLIPFMLKCCHHYRHLSAVPSLITIHNGQYQGWFGFNKLPYIPSFDLGNIGLLEWNNLINPLAAAIKCAWKVTTVSQSYLDEISQSANGLENLLRMERQKSVGILNGIDNELWNPATDKMLPANYNQKTVAKGKAACKQFLCQEFNLDPDKPLFAFIGRLVGEKGADLLPDIFSYSLERHARELNILMLGSGDKQTEARLALLASRFPGNYNTYIGYNEQLSHIMYAGADFLLMPSRVEPCGLNQMYAMRYGTVPIVRRTGGLKDTVTDIGDGGFGICHDQASVSDVVYSIDRAMALFEDKKYHLKVIRANMAIDHSWESVAGSYQTLYSSLKS